MRKYIISFLVFVSLLLIYWGNKEYSSNIYRVTDGVVTERDVTTINIINAEKQVAGINVFVNKIKYRLCVSFEYRIGKNKYKSEFYNNGNESGYHDKHSFKKILKNYPKNKKFKVYYNKQNPRDCGINLVQIKKRNAKIYYLLSIITIGTLAFYLFFSDFFIND